MGWIATKAIVVLRAGSYVDLKPGEPCPEAETWPNLSAWERLGHVRRVPDDAPRAAPAVAVPRETRTLPEHPEVKADCQEPVPFKPQPQVQVATQNQPQREASPHRWGTRELRRKSKEELVDLAARHGVRGAEDLRRDDIIQAIRTAQG